VAPFSALFTNPILDISRQSGFDDGAGETGLASQDVVENIPHVPNDLIGELARQHLIKNDPQGINIGLARISILEIKPSACSGLTFVPYSILSHCRTFRKL